MTRSEALTRLLSDTGFAAAVREPLAGDASTRRYERLTTPTRRAVLMDAPPRAESSPCPPTATPAERRALGWNATARLAASRVEAFAAVGAHLRGLGLTAPEIFGLDLNAGYAVLEDLGDDLFARVLTADPAKEIALYEEAARLLAHVHAAPMPDRIEGPAGAAWPLLDYDALALEVNADLFIEWLPRLAQVQIKDRERARWEAVRDALIVKALGFPRAFTIRDFHAENLIWLPDRQSLQRIGLLDFQDALRGWRGWDFTMLLDDARRDVSLEAREAAIAAYLAAADAEPTSFARELAVLGGLNCMRIIGRFAQLAHDGKPRYLEFMPRMWGHLARNLAHPALSEARAFVTDIARPYLERAA